MESVSACPLCGDGRFEVIGDRDRRGSPLLTVACRGCGLARTEPLPSAEDLHAFYETEYRLAYKGSRRPSAKHVVRAARLAAARYEELSRYLAPCAAALDVGAGLGAWVRLLAHKGVRARGIEPDRGYAEFAREELGADVENLPLDAAEFGAGSLDAVSMFHVLEHVRDPVAALRRCLGWLCEGGALIVEVPNIASPRQNPRARFHRAHLFGFTPATLELAGRRAGGRPLEVRLDRYERNVMAVFVPGASEPSPPPDPSAVLASIRGRSAFAYALSPVTAWRAAERLGGFASERVAAWREPNPAKIVERAAGIR